MPISQIGTNSIASGTTLAAPTFSGTSTFSGGVANSYGFGVGTAVPSSGSGIAFPATQNASSDANTLDDYEEGTWTPTLLGSSSNPTVTYTLQYGAYTKIGNVVHLTFNLRTSARTGGTGMMQIGGLPFAPATNAYQAGCFGDMNNITFDNTRIQSLMTAAGITYLFLEELVSNAGAVSLNVTNWGASGQMNGSIVYLAST